MEVINNNEIFEKRKRGRPKNPNIINNDLQKRRYIVNVEYLKKRYHTDEIFREKCKQRRKEYYLKKKEQKEYEKIDKLLE